jgi:hypothetical protein
VCRLLVNNNKKEKMASLLFPGGAVVWGLNLHGGFQLTTIKSDAAKSVHACPVERVALHLIPVRPQVESFHEVSLGRFILALKAVDSAKCEVSAG